MLYISRTRMETVGVKGLSYRCRSFYQDVTSAAKMETLITNQLGSG